MDPYEPTKAKKKSLEMDNLGSDNAAQGVLKQCNYGTQVSWGAACTCKKKNTQAHTARGGG